MKNILFALLLSTVFAGCAGYAPGRQSYWDAQVREMCAKDGGFRMFERLKVSEKEVALLDKLDGKISVPSKNSAHPNSPAYSEFSLTTIHSAGNLLVDRAESKIVRRMDQIVIAQWIVYKRSGGDLPTGLAHDSSFICPDIKTIASDMQQLFVIEGDSK